jgi:membrane protein implicated in regulation of membrane protease activity
MVSLFVICAACGGTVLLAQFALSLVGLADHHGDGDVHADGHDHDGAHPSPLAGLLSVRALSAAVCLFGLIGLAATAAGLGVALSLLLAGGAGAGAGALTAAAVRGLHRLRAEGTLNLREAIGQNATVYLTIPEKRSGLGKVTLCLQNRTVECDAVTAQGRLPSGSRVLVVDVIGTTLLVEPDPVLPEAGEPRN